MCNRRQARACICSLAITLIYLVYQLDRISHHRIDEYNDANEYIFAQNFDLYSISRTTKHEKDIDDWFNWIQYEANMQTFNKTLTLLHIDPHGAEDNAQEYHICTPPNLFVYDFFVEQLLDSAVSTYFDDFKKYGNGSITRHALRKGFVNHIVWVYPDHWCDYSQSEVMGTNLADYRAMIRHQTYFISPHLTHIFFLKSETNTDNPLWERQFGTEANRYTFKAFDERPDPLEYLEINIWAMTLDEYLHEPTFTEMERNSLIVDIDLDFFQCQEPAMTFMNHHGWTAEHMNKFNDILQHHQYLPTHLPQEHATEALLTLIHNLNKVDDAEDGSNPVLDALKSYQPSYQPSNVEVDEDSCECPLVEDVLRESIHERMDIPTIERALYLLYEYQLERAQIEPDALQHIAHYDRAFETLNRAKSMMRRRLKAGFKILSRHAEYHVPHSEQSRHWSRLREIARKKYAEEKMRKERAETDAVKKTNDDWDGVHHEMDGFVEHLLRHHHKGESEEDPHLMENLHRQLQSVEVHSDGQQTVLDTEGGFESEMELEDEMESGDATESEHETDDDDDDEDGDNDAEMESDDETESGDGDDDEDDVDDEEETEDRDDDDDGDDGEDDEDDVDDEEDDAEGGDDDDDDAGDGDDEEDDDEDEEYEDDDDNDGGEDEDEDNEDDTEFEDESISDDPNERKTIPTTKAGELENEMEAEYLTDSEREEESESEGEMEPEGTTGFEQERLDLQSALDDPDTEWVKSSGTEQSTDPDDLLDPEAKFLRNDALYPTDWTDSLIKQRFNMTGDYLYTGWKPLLFGEGKRPTWLDHGSWKGKYPQWIHHGLKDALDDEESSPTEKQADVGLIIKGHSDSLYNEETAPYNQDNDHMQQHEEVEDSVSKDTQSRFQLKWTELDPLQLHFIHSGDHSKLHSFISGLNAHQSRFMEWLVFCYYHRVQCRGARHLPERFNKSFHFGHDFVWYELNGWPQLEEHEESGALQMGVGRYTEFKKFWNGQPEEVTIKPTKEELEGTLEKLMRVMEADNAEVIMVGIEQSPGHIPKKDLHDLECEVFSWIERSLYYHGDKPGFVRLRKVLDDALLPFAPCANRLFNRYRT